jgi:hypothetical protein
VEDEVLGQASARAALRAKARWLLLRCVAALAASATIGGCANLVPVKRIDIAEAKWNAAGVQSYSYNLGVGSLLRRTPCSADSVVEVEVRDGKTVKFGSCSPESEMAQSFGSVPRMFDTIRSDRRERPPRYLVRFESVLGYPESIDANYSRWFTDHAVQYYVRDFRKLE